MTKKVVAGGSAVKTEVAELPKKLQAAEEIIAESCRDHCKYHANERVCKNCSIFQKIQKNALNVNTKGE